MLQESAAQTLTWQGRKLPRLSLAELVRGSLPPYSIFRVAKHFPGMPEVLDESALGTQACAEQKLSQLCFWLCKLRRAVQRCAISGRIYAPSLPGTRSPLGSAFLDTNGRDQGLCLNPGALPLLLPEPRPISPAR